MRLRNALIRSIHSVPLACLCLLWALPGFGQELHDAVYRSDADEVARLIAGGADVNERDVSGWTPLHEAVRVSPNYGSYRPIEIAGALVRAGADVGIGDDLGRTALHLAASALNYEAVDLLLRAGAELTPDNWGRTPLHWAVWSSALEGFTTNAIGSCNPGDPAYDLGCYYDAIIRRLLAAPGPLDSWPSLSKDEDGRTPLHGGIRTPAAARALLGDIPNGYIPAGPAAFDHKGRSPWFYVRYPWVFQVMREQLHQPAFLGTRDEDERTPLHFAETEGMVRAMLEADPSLIEARGIWGWTPLHYRASRGGPATVGALLAAGADANAADDFGGTPISLAAGHVHHSGIGDIRDISHPQGAALYFSNRQSARSIIESLLEAGGRVDVEDRWGGTPLHRAARFGSVDALQALLESSSSGLVNQQNSSGNTPLHEAVYNPIPEASEAMVRALLAAGADASIPNASGRTALGLLQNLGSGRIDSYASVIAALQGAAGSVPPDIEVVLGGSGESVTLRGTEAGYTLNGSPVGSGAVLSSNSGAEYRLDRGADGTWTATFAPRRVDVILGESGEWVTLTTTEAGGYTLDGEAASSGTVVTGSDGARYRLDQGADGAWAATLVPTGGGSTGRGDDHGNSAGTATEVTLGLVGLGDWDEQRIADVRGVIARIRNRMVLLVDLYRDGGLSSSDLDVQLDRQWDAADALVNELFGSTGAMLERTTSASRVVDAFDWVVDALSDGDAFAEALDDGGIFAGLGRGLGVRSGRIDAAGDEDWFRFETAGSVRVAVYTTGATDTHGELDSSRSDDDTGEGTNFRIEAAVGAGAHLVRVSGSGSATGAYTLHVRQLSGGGGSAGPEAGETWTSPLGMEFVGVPAGSFVMGSPEDEEGRYSDEVQHEVRISRGFWMGKYEVTQGEWEAVMGANPSYFDECGARCPVEMVSWDAVQEFIRRLNERESGSGYEYRLPTEAEWEYAARAGTTGARHGELDLIAWYSDRRGRTHPVGQKRANAWGLHDMLGNVWEWTADWYGVYPSGAVTDPRGPDTGSTRVSRGGCWGCDAGTVRSATRNRGAPDPPYYLFGFRLVRTAEGAEGSGGGSVPPDIEVVLGASGDRVTLRGIEGGGYTLFGDRVSSGTVVTGSDGARYRLDQGADGVWTATLVPTGGGSTGRGDDHGNSAGTATEVTLGLVGLGNWDEQRIAYVRGEIAKIRDRVASLVDLYRDGGLSSSDLDVQLDRQWDAADALVNELFGSTGATLERTTSASRVVDAFDWVVDVLSDADAFAEALDDGGIFAGLGRGLGVRSGRIDAAGDEDWFRFETLESVRVAVYTTGATDTYGELDSSWSDDDAGEGTNFRIEAAVAAGAHFVRVSGFGSWTGAYTLHVRQLPGGGGSAGPAAGETWTSPLGMEFVGVPAGSFVMGSPEDEEGRDSDEVQHEVRISRGFWMGRYEVTQGEWEAVMGANPSYFTECGARCPVERVSWYRVQEFIRRLNERESGSGYEYRLPTAAEWEYAARAGTTGARHGELDSIAWYSDSNSRQRPVGQKGANAWGLHDMLGNVWEWTADWYGEYPSGAVTDPQGPFTGSARVIRGGGWGTTTRGSVRSARRGGTSPGIGTRRAASASAWSGRIDPWRYYPFTLLREAGNGAHQPAKAGA